VGTVQTSLSYGVLVALALLVLFPFYWMTVTSFKSEEQMRSLVSMFWPRPLVGENYGQLVAKTDFLKWYGNSATVAISSTLLATAVGTVGAYALARLRFLGRGFMASATLITYLVPPSILFIPLATMVYRLNLFDTRLALILTYPTFLIPFCTWLLMGYFKTIPREIEDCARIDGASRIQAMIRISFPLAVPGILSAGIFAFTLSWNEFLYALVFLASPSQKTIPIGVFTELVRGDVFYWGPLMAGALLGSIPVALVYSMFVEHYVTALTGAVKG
jgi:multiple sugar transport system permease protein